MNINIITLFPELMQQATEFGVLGRAIKQQKLKLQCFNPRDYTEDRHRTVDDRPYGGGPGIPAGSTDVGGNPLLHADVISNGLFSIGAIPAGTTELIPGERQYGFRCVK